MRPKLSSAPDPQRPPSRRLTGRSGPALVGLTAGLVAALVLAISGGSLRQRLLDAYQIWMPGPPVSARVHVVVIDAESLRRMGGWPWSRAYLARLVDEIAARGAAAVGLAILLPEPDRATPSDFVRLYPELSASAAAEVARLPSMDAVLARTVGRHPVVLARAGVRLGASDDLPEGRIAAPPPAVFSGRPPPAAPRYAGALSNLTILDGAAAGLGLVNGEPEPDGVLRRVPLAATAAGHLTPGFALETVRIAQGAPPVRFDDRSVCLGDTCVPSTAEGDLLLRFGDWRRTAVTSAADLLRRGVPADRFRGQVVLVGVSAAGVGELVTTPASAATPGVFVQAQAVDAILRGAGLARPGWLPPLEWALGLLALAALAMAPLRAPWPAVAAGVGLWVSAALVASALAFDRNFVLDPFPLLTPALVAAMAMLGALLVGARRERRRLRAAIAAERAESDARQQQLINELNHRVKNTLATVQGMALQTLRGGRAPGEAGGAFVERLMALSAAHNLLNEVHWGAADLGAVVRTVTAPYDDPPGSRFRIEGPPTPMRAGHAVAFALALHELSSNALKHGALSSPGGEVRIAWRRIEDGQVEFRWVETGGPKVEGEISGGFGARVIRQGLARDLGGQVRLMPRPSGLTCEIVFRPD